MPAGKNQTSINFVVNDELFELIETHRGRNTRSYFVREAVTQYVLWLESRTTDAQQPDIFAFAEHLASTTEKEKTQTEVFERLMRTSK